MADKTINVILASKATGDGFKKTEGGCAKTSKASADLIVNVKKLGNAFGELGNTMGSVAQNFLKGSIWGLAADGARFLWDQLVSLCDQTEVLRRQMERADRASEKFAKTAAEDMKKLADSHAATVKAIDDELSRRQRSIDLLAKERDAVLELEKQKRLAAGQNADVVNQEISRFATTQSLDDRDTQLSDTIDANKRKLADIDKQIRKREELAMKLRGNEADLRRAAKREKAEQAEWMRLQAEDAGSYNPLSRISAYMNDDEIDVRVDRVNRAFARADKAKGLVDQNDEALRALREQQRAARRAIKDAGQEREIIAAKREAAEIQFAREDKERRDKAAAEEADAAKKAAEERQKAEIAAAQAAAKERERLDREAHQKRMADLRAEIDMQNKAKASQSAIAAAAQSEFERAFAMYRDPERAAQEIGEEKARSADLDRLHKDARRYGGQWRIDELSALMSAGDTQGVQSRLQEWRKNGRFDASTEALVRASAAEQTRTTAEDELRKISANTAGLAAKLDELLAMKE